ncbi:Glyoxalase-like domain protein [Nonomuraea coxensis DSM 45129]|uniref:Glyoxalase-like domain protein n=1 Tax=Nonomuraea coxensis DSM 45129 TaxID=1122611 RepID=A0ABX8TU62_9ACTN|nr:VOC family protein [Nonomuraea coxensis]QYC37843.1 Glyoxalase-like domain protein [Nonomuraea coxensis DSM 45129]
MAVPNMFIFYVSDAPASARFYAELFEMTPSFESPGFISFDLAGGVQFAVWGGGPDRAVPSRTSELCLALDGGREQIDRQFKEWAHKDVTIVEEPHDEIFGRTFVVADPDGNLIRVAPVD